MIIEFKTRQTRPTSQDPVICVDDEHAASRLARVIRNALIDAESHGIALEQTRTLLVNALQYVEAKIAARTLP
jgi:hypothetical protein